VSPEEHCKDDAESVTLTEYAEVTLGEVLRVDEMAAAMGVVHTPSEYHSYE
jgi:hypothetical protein